MTPRTTVDDLETRRDERRGVEDPRGLCEGETEAPGEYIPADRPGESGLTHGTHM